MGQFQETQPGWGTRSHIVLQAGPLPNLGLLQSPERGICVGAQQEGGVGLRGSQRSQTACP